jgi:hypothetical protein
LPLFTTLAPRWWLLAEIPAGSAESILTIRYTSFINIHLLA